MSYEYKSACRGTLVTLLATIPFQLDPIRGRANALCEARHVAIHPSQTRLGQPELGARYRRIQDPVERSHWRFVRLLMRGFTANAIASFAEYSVYWIGQIARAAITP